MTDLGRRTFVAVMCAACGASPGSAVAPHDTAGGGNIDGAAPAVACTAAATLPTELATPTGRIAGTMVMPEVCGSPVPIVLFHAGSGPTDRDGNAAAASLKTDAYKLLALALADHGIASVRYDKRGVGASAAAGPSSELDYRFSMYVDDAVAWIGQLRRDARFSRVIVAGHSEGSLVGMLAVAQAGADAFVSLEGAGRPAGELIRAQLTPKLSGTLLAQSNHILDELEAGRTVATVPHALEPVFRPSVQPYLISWFRFDPAASLAALRVPTLIVQGTTDTQVDVVADADRLAGAKPDAHLLVVDGMCHPLKAATRDAASQRSAYTDPSIPLAPGLVEGLLPLLNRGR